jgi:carbon starvation protein
VDRHIWVPLIPFVFMASVTFTAGVEKIFHPRTEIGFLAQARALTSKLDSGAIVADQIEVTQKMIFNAQLDAVIAAVFLFLVGAIVLFSVRRWFLLLTGRAPLDLHETPPVWLDKTGALITFLLLWFIPCIARGQF